MNPSKDEAKFEHSKQNKDPEIAENLWLVFSAVLPFVLPCARREGVFFHVFAVQPYSLFFHFCSRSTGTDLGISQTQILRTLTGTFLWSPNPRTRCRFSKFPTKTATYWSQFENQRRREEHNVSRRWGEMGRREGTLKPEAELKEGEKGETWWTSLKQGESRYPSVWSHRESPSFIQPYHIRWKSFSLGPSGHSVSKLWTFHWNHLTPCCSRW